MSLFVVRHGQTVDNAARIIQLPTALLSDEGRAQAQRLAARLSSETITRILVSDFVRTLETAEAVGGRLGLTAEPEPLLRERDFGDLRGRPYASLDFDPFAPDYVPPQGESEAVFHSRVGRAWEAIRRAVHETPGDLLVVSHGLFCRALVERHLALEPGVSLPARWENTSVTRVDAAPPWTVRELNCVAHLDDPGAETVREGP